EISEYLRAACSEMNVVLDADSSPTRTVDPRLDRYHRACPKRRLDRFRQAWRFVNLESQSMTQTVSEGVAITPFLDVATSQTIGILPLHSRAQCARGNRGRVLCVF